MKTSFLKNTIITSIDGLREAYPELNQEDGAIFRGPGSYNPMIESWGVEVIIQKDEHDYQGDTYLLLKYRSKYGFLCFGWGSCSGCDALQACETWKNLLELSNTLLSQIVWHNTKEEMLDWMEKRDWDFYTWSKDARDLFLLQAKEYLQK